MTVSENFTKKVYRGGKIMRGGFAPLPTSTSPRPQNRLKGITSLSNINSKIKKMRCNVCQSQSSIDKVMGRNQKVCDMCDTIITTVNPPIKNNNPQKGINTNLLKSNIPINTSVNIVNETTKMASAYKNLETISKSRELNNALKNNGFSINAAGRGAKAENNANAAAIKVGGRRSTYKRKNRKNRKGTRRNKN